MTDETKVLDVDKGADETAKDASSENKETAKVEKKDDGMIPRHRLNESETKRREAEEKLEKLSKDFEVTNSKLEALGRALSGATSQGERDSELEAFEKKFNLQGTGFADEFLALTTKKLSKSQQTQDPAVIEAVLEVQFNKELDKLTDELPEVEKLTREERKELKARALSKEFIRTPLKTVYRDMMYDKKDEGGKTFEESRSGGRAVDDGEPDFGKMSADEMRAWSAKNLKSRRHR